MLQEKCNKREKQQVVFQSMVSVVTYFSFTPLHCLLQNGLVSSVAKEKLKC